MHKIIEPVTSKAFKVPMKSFIPRCRTWISKPLINLISQCLAYFSNQTKQILILVIVLSSANGKSNFIKVVYSYTLCLKHKK